MKPAVIKRLCQHLQALDSWRYRKRVFLDRHQNKETWDKELIDMNKELSWHIDDACAAIEKILDLGLHIKW